MKKHFLQLSLAVTMMASTFGGSMSARAAVTQPESAPTQRAKTVMPTVSGTHNLDNWGVGVGTRLLFPVGRRLALGIRSGLDVGLDFPAHHVSDRSDVGHQIYPSPSTSC